MSIGMASQPSGLAVGPHGLARGGLVWPPPLDLELELALDCGLPELITVDGGLLERVDPVYGSIYATAAGSAKPGWSAELFASMDKVDDMMTLSATLSLTPPFTLHRLVRHTDEFVTLCSSGSANSADMTNYGANIANLTGGTLNQATTLAFTNVTWHAQSITYDTVGGTLKFYEDGAKLGEDATPGGATFAANAIGGFNGAYGYGDGYWRVLMAYNLEHSAGQVAQMAYWLLTGVGSDD